MKKQLLLAALILGAASANAQIEKITVDGSAVGLGAEATAVTAGTVLGSSESVTVKAAYDDSYKVVSCAYQGYNNVIVNGESFSFGDGVQGSTNPKGQSLVGSETSTPPTSGAVIQLDVNKDGYIVVVSKLSSNKEYYVWEGDANWAAPVAYSLYMDWSSANNAANPTITYTWPADDMGYLDFAAADLDKYVDLAAGKARWPEKVVLGADAADVKKNGVGVIIFPVYADAGTYLVQAAGSKISVPGVIFSENPITDLQITGANPDTGEPLSITFLGEGSETGVNGIQAEKAEVEGQTYDLGGRPATKGLLIQKGKAKSFVK